ncbi:MAG: prepilin-type N-terminal cleavage/methylation domain-containing protein [Deltaproteobacteria bacterium]|nr:prepilin-type N-terminal cleavage/methylation domain-containing protein [Kofleriaceae bacterium]
MRRRRHQQGFTLLELLVTMGVTVVGLMGVLSLYVVTARSNASGAHGGEAVAIAEATVEEIRGMAIPELLVAYSAPALPLDVSLDTVAGRAGTTFDRRVQVTELTATSTNLVKIRVEVSWTESGATAGAEGGIHDRRISLELIRTASEAL